MAGRPILPQAPTRPPAANRSPDTEDTLVIDRGNLTDEEIAGATDDTGEAVEEVTLTEDHFDRLRNTIAPRRDAARLRLPRPGACIFLIIDTAILTELADSDATKFLAEIRLVSDVADYHVTLEEGKITIIGTAERAANSLLAIADSLRKITPNVRALLGQGVIEHDEADSFKVNGSPDEQTTRLWQEKPASIYLSSQLAANIIKPGSREGSHCDIQVKITDDEGLMTLEGYKPRVERYTGGPDILIGYEEPLVELNRFLRDDDTKLVFLRGQAGIGKSRILSEVLATLPSHTLCSLDAADRNIPGASLVTLADQLAQIIKGDDDVLGGDNTHELTRFSAKTRAEKIVYAQRHGKDLAELCFNALQLTTWIKGQKSVFILEDLHNADRLSEPLLVNVAQRYALETEGKSLVSMRPEEMYRSNAQDDLKGNLVKHYGHEAVGDVELQGLDFSDEQISRRFTYHCIPTQKRGGKTVEQMGTWHAALGKAAGNSPFVMTSLMQAVLEKEGALSTEGEIIAVDRELVTSLGEISPDDPKALATHLHQRIANLSQNARIALQAIALAGGRLTAGQIDKIVEKMVGGAIGKKMEVFQALREGGFIHAAEGEKEYKRWEFQHELLIPFVISSITTLDDRVTMSNYLYNILEEDPETHADTKLALLQNIVTGLETPEPDNEIWPRYKDAALAALNDANDHNNTAKTAAIAASILDKTQGSSRIQAAITDLQENEEVPEALAQLAVASLMAAAESALNLGRFQQVEERTNELIKIHGYNPDLVNIDHVYLLLFEKAYLQRDKKQMAKMFTDYIKGVATIPATAKIICTIKIAFREGKFDEASKLFETNKDQLYRENEGHKAEHEGMPSPDYIEMLRLATVRIPFAATRDSAAKVDDRTGLDSDCLYQPGALSGEQRSQLDDEIVAALDRIRTITKVFPTILSPHSELALLDQTAEIEGFRGNWAAADKAYKEAWRIADQMQNHDAAARIAKGRADNLVTQALLASTDSTFATTDMGLLKRAVEVYNREATISTSQLEKGSYWPLVVRINRIRAISLLALRYRGESGQKSKAALRMEMAPYFDQAFKDFENINQEHTGPIDPEVAYYLLAPFDSLLVAANALEYPIPDNLADSEKYPYMSVSACAGGLAYGASVTDRGLNLGEASHKRKSLFQLLQGLTELRDRRLEQQG